MSTGYLFIEMRVSGDRTPNRRVRPFSVKAMAACFKEYLEYAGLGARHDLNLFKVGCAVT